jgi:hypothetical protein
MTRFTRENGGNDFSVRRAISGEISPEIVA